MWCDNTENNHMDSEEDNEALRCNLIYYEGNPIHSMESWKPLQKNFRRGGMKKVLEEEMVAKGNYA